MGGSTTSFTVTDMTSRDTAASRNNSGEGSVTSRQRWRVSPTPSSTPTPSLLSSSAAKTIKTNSVKRERSVPSEKHQKEEEDEDDQAISDTELMGSPKKRKKTGLFDGHLLEKVDNLFLK